MHDRTDNFYNDVIVGVRALSITYSILEDKPFI